MKHFIPTDNASFCLTIGTESVDSTNVIYIGSMRYTAPNKDSCRVRLGIAKDEDSLNRFIEAIKAGKEFANDFNARWKWSASVEIGKGKITHTYTGMDGTARKLVADIKKATTVLGSISPNTYNGLSGLNEW